MKNEGTKEKRKAKRNKYKRNKEEEEVIKERVK
jgi:hypothetical protein